MTADPSLLLKHYCLLNKNIASLSDGQARVEEPPEDSDALTSVHVSVAPRSGPYRGGKFDFVLDLGEGYPNSPPAVRATTPMYHPNVELSGFEDEDDGCVCLNLLDELWMPSMTLEDVIQGLLFLFHNPNLDDPLSSLFLGTEDEEEFHSDVRRSLRGGNVAGVLFERNLLDGYDSECEDDDEGDAPGNSDNLVSTEDVLAEAGGDRDPGNKTSLVLSLNVLPEVDETETETDKDTQLYNTTLPSPTPSLPSPPLEVSANGDWGLFSQLNPPLCAFDKMWALSLSSTMRTIVFGAQRTQQLARVDSSEIDVR